MISDIFFGHSVKLDSAYTIITTTLIYTNCKLALKMRCHSRCVLGLKRFREDMLVTKSTGIWHAIRSMRIKFSNTVATANTVAIILQNQLCKVSQVGIVIQWMSTELRGIWWTPMLEGLHVKQQRGAFQTFTNSDICWTLQVRPGEQSVLTTAQLNRLKICTIVRRT